MIEAAHALRRAVRKGEPDPLLLGETYVPMERLGGYLGNRPGEAFDLVFDFEFLYAGWDADRLRFVVDRAEGLLPAHGWPCRALSSHDNPRRRGSASGRCAPPRCSFSPSAVPRSSTWARRSG